MGLGNSVLGMKTKVQTTEAKNTKQNKTKQKQVVRLQQTKRCRTAKETADKRKRQPMEWEKILANHLSYTELVSKIYKVLI